MEGTGSKEKMEGLYEVFGSSDPTTQEHRDKLDVSIPGLDQVVRVSLTY